MCFANSCCELKSRVEYSKRKTRRNKSTLGNMFSTIKGMSLG
uniref:Uncharacterized protein n=1 Tax=Rhizophora mucronata TaxID=61149 RepID=A0A2P2NF13_RHIMU